MNNLHRELAPITSAAWDEIEEEARRTFKRNIAGRRIVDVPEAHGLEFSALGTGHLSALDAGIEGVEVRRRESIPVFEIRVPFTVSRAAVDDVDRGSADSDWQPVKDAAEAIALAEDRAVLEGSETLGIKGISMAATQKPVELPSETRDIPAAVAKAVSTLRLDGVSGPYNLLLSADLYTEVLETTDHGYPVHEHIGRVLKDGEITWAPAIDGAMLTSARGGDFELHLGQDLSIGYHSHDSENINLYLQESFTFRVAGDEAAVRIN
ncbi:family 1 encapsulin nanocompartment shell protein [Dietzia sp.]|uniref:family 1 encapsulin nanocompartment shell protein n=1 Tax=Dietzia sp. TaxID=1871616 RepID=UPI002FDB23C4